MSVPVAVLPPPAFPLSAIVGQRALVEALLVIAVDPRIGGVLVRGERGTAKTTAVRALAPLLPTRDGDQPAPLVELPLGATLDRLVGSLDLARALDGEHRYEAGLLARADGGILYVDEVNLLADHLVDALLDAAATGVVTVERESVSARHATRFLLVGTMNPEEGELRPQLLDRFGLGVEVLTPTEPAARGEIVRRRLAYETDPVAFTRRFAEAEDELAARLSAARARLAAVRLPARELDRITRACAQLGIDGVRGDIVTARTARALAAIDGAEEVTGEHVRRAAALALVHRRRRDPLDGQAPDPDDLSRALQDGPEPSGGDDGGGHGDGEGGGDDGDGGGGGGGGDGGAGSGAPAGDGAADRGAGDGRAAGDGAAGEPPSGDEASADGRPATPPTDSSAPGASGPGPAREHDAAPASRGRVQAPVEARLPATVLRLPGVGRGPTGRRARSAGPGAGVIDSRVAGDAPEDLAVVATLCARLAEGPEASLRTHVRAGREGALVCLLVDASGSMSARRRAARVKGALIALLRDAYAARDRVAVIAFRDARAQLLVVPGAPIERAAQTLRELPTGGGTPLAEGLRTAEAVIRRESMRDPTRRSLAVVLSDGRVADPDGAIARAAAALGRVADRVEVIDTEEGPVRVGLAPALAAAAGAGLHTFTPPRRAA